MDDLYTSDHFPVVIDYIQDSPMARIPKFNFDKADWNKFNVLTKEIDSFNVQRDHNDMDAYFMEFTLKAAKESIPMSGNTTITKRTVPWWNGELSDIVKEKHYLSRRIDKLNRRLKYLLHQRFSLFGVISLTLEIDCLKTTLK